MAIGSKNKSTWLIQWFVFALDHRHKVSIFGEDLYPTISTVDNKDFFAIGRHTKRLVEFALGRSFSSETLQQTSVAVKLHDTVVIGVCDEYRVILANADECWVVETACVADRSKQNP